MHLALICNEYPPAPHGGIGSSSQDLAEGLVQAGHRVTVMGVYPNLTEAVSETVRGAKIIRFPFKPCRWYRPGVYVNRWRLKRWLAKEHRQTPFDLLLVPDYEGWLPWRSVRDLPVVAWLQGSNYFFDTELKRVGEACEHKMEQKTVRRADYWLGLSQYVYDKTLQLCGTEPALGEIIPHAVDPTIFSPGPEPMEPGLIVFVNTVNTKKGVEQLIDAANLVFPSRPNSRLMLIGGSKTAPDSDGKTYLDKLRERIHPDNRARVEFAGRMDRSAIIPWLRKANVCCYPSHMETFGLAPVEAMSVGRATIYSRTGPGPEVVEDGVSGLLCDPANPRDIAAKIGQILDQPALAESLGRAGRQRVLERFDKTKWIAAHLEFYAKCIADFKKRRAS